MARRSAALAADPGVKPMKIEVSQRTLQAGIRVFRARKNWPRDFHADLYARQDNRRAAGLTEQWWSETLEDLRRWRALRPITTIEVRPRGLRVLSRLNEAYNRLPLLGVDFGGVAWSDLETRPTV